MTDTSTVSTTTSTLKTEPPSESKEARILLKLLEKKQKKGLKNRKYTNPEEEIVDKIVHKAFESIIGKDQYSPLKTTEWMNKMIQKVSKELLKKRENSRKIVVHCTICSKTDDLSICSANMCSWDVERDVAVYSEWTSKTVFGAVHVFFVTHRFSK
ncbi:unnamed protein product [Caenorhabditis brenneri]